MPPLLWNYARRSLGALVGIQFCGHFKSWSDAVKASSGYEEEGILNKAVEAVRKVRNGEMAFERDGVPFPEMQHNFPLLWALTRAAASHGRLHILDFGGALGSSYYQSRQLLRPCSALKWAIVEQPSHVVAGNKEFANSELGFYDSIESAFEKNDYDVLLLSGVIQYLPDPLNFLSQVLDRGISTIIVDRTPFMENGISRLTVQYVPRTIYRASYPAWFLSEKEVLSKFEKQYETIASWPALDKHDPQGGRAAYKGFLFELRNGSKPSVRDIRNP
jgi:putative methyltransferase (TIGR04325 family)